MPLCLDVGVKFCTVPHVHVYLCISYIVIPCILYIRRMVIRQTITNTYKHIDDIVHPETVNIVDSTVCTGRISR